MHVRELPLEEWDRVRNLGHFATCGLPNPEYSRILVVETDEGQIVGIWFAMNVVHLEGLWIEPSHRGKSAVGRKLLYGMMKFLKNENVKNVFTLSIEPYITRLALHAGFKQLPGEALVLVDGDKS